MKKIEEATVRLDANRFLARSVFLGNEALGVYVKLICQCQIRGGIVRGDDIGLRDLLGMHNVRTVHRTVGELLEKGFIQRLPDGRIMAGPP